jgi:16S rRNA (cytosine967-C5)-methyltransferase
MPPARRAAFLALEQRRGKRVASALSLQAALDQVLRAMRLAPQDAALGTNMAYGALRFKERLEWLLNKFLSRPERLAPAHRDILLLATYELVFLDAVPPYASLNWAVEASKSAFGTSLGALSNAVLRKVAALAENARSRAFFTAEIKNSQCLSSVWHCQPEWLVSHFAAHYSPPEARAYFEAFLADPVLGVRINRRKPGWEALAVKLAAEEGCILAQGSGLAFNAAAKPASLEQLIREGSISRQSYASQEALSALLNIAHTADANFSAALQGGVWDACAGHGGKTCALLEQGIAVILASDPHSGRLAGLQGDITRLDLTEIAPVLAVADATAPCPLRVCPSVILADVPCSGLGTLNRRPDIKYNRKPEDLSLLADLQRRILDNLHACLPAGGWLLYLTCTLNSTENQNQITALIERHPDVKLAGTWQTPSNSPVHEFFYGAALKKG